MDLQALFNSTWGTGLATDLPRLLPPRIGKAISVLLADAVARRRSSGLVRAVSANQWIIRDCKPDPRELQQHVRAVLRQRARCLFDLFHNLDRPDMLERLSPMTPEMARLMEQSRQGQHGVILALAHLSNYELILMAAGRRGLKAQLLAPPNPPGGYQRLYRVWATTEVETTPTAVASLRQAADRLKRGGMVVMGVDRPAPSNGPALSFFGRPSQLPAGHIRLALLADVPIVPAAVQRCADGTYTLRIADPLEVIRYRDPHETLRLNAEAVLHVLESYIAQTPDQWFMFFPVWPDGPAAP